MSFNLVTIEGFKREAKRLIKKYPSLRVELEDLGRELEKNPRTGTMIGNGFYKIRLAIRSKGRGKGGGARVITYTKIVEETVFLVSIYDKSEKSDISDAELKTFLGQLPG